ncbi:MAG: hypothetical protein ACRD0D_02505 [Acidimicrobiales bacterium]
MTWRKPATQKLMASSSASHTITSGDAASAAAFHTPAWRPGR